MNSIIKANLSTLQKATFLISNLSDEILRDNSVSPYYSSVGSHIRHILDFYECILKPVPVFDLTSRCRNIEVESSCKNALDYLNSIIDKLENVDSRDLGKEVKVFDDLGLGKDMIIYTYAALFAQANSHAIHHYAIINYILNGLKVSISDNDFGYNPSTPKPINLN